MKKERNGEQQEQNKEKRSQRMDKYRLTCTLMLSMFSFLQAVGILLLCCISVFVIGFVNIVAHANAATVAVVGAVADGHVETSIYSFPW